MDVGQQSAPAYLLEEALTSGIPAEPNEPCFAHDMIFGYEAPEARIGRVVPIVTHHPVVVHLAGILRCLCAIDIYLAAFLLQLIAFIYLYEAFVLTDGTVVQIQFHAFLRYRDGAEIVYIPVIAVYVIGEDIPGVIHRHLIIIVERLHTFDP